MKKLTLIFGCLLFFTNSIIANAETILGATVISTDATSYPGGGKIDASSGIASYHNWGLRMYFVDAKTGTRYGIVKDFVSSTPNKMSEYYYYGSVKKDVYNLSNIDKNNLKKGYEKFVSVNQKYYDQYLPTDPGKNKESTRDIENFFKNLYLKTVKYPGNSKIDNALQLFMIEELKVPVSKVESISIDSNEYYIMVEPVRYFKILNGLLALTATESPLVINEKNYGSALYNGVTVKHPFWNDGYKIEYKNVIPTSACLKKIESGTMPNDPSKSVYSSCLSISWWQYNTLVNYTPKSVVHEQAYTIGGFTYGKFTNKSSYNTAEVIGVSNGLGLGFVNVGEYLKKASCNLLSLGDLYKDLPRCCSDPRASGAPNYASLCTPPAPGGNPGNPSTCDYNVNANYPSSCSSNTSGQISDINDWQCIFDSKTNGGANYSNHYIELENSYCSVFCREDINYDFPKSSITVLAGNHFTVGSNTYGNAPKWNPIYISGTATCKTNGINQSKFTSDFKKANDDINVAWNNLQIALAKEKSVNGATFEANCSTCSYKFNVGGFPHCSEVGYNTVVNPATGTSTNVAYCKTNNYEKYGKFTPINSYYNGVNYKQSPYYENSPKPTFDIASLRNTYTTTISARDNHLKEINQCVNFKFDYSTLSPSINLEYEEEKYGIRTDLVTDSEETFETTHTNGGTAYLDSYVCSEEGKTCYLDKKSVSYPTSTNIEHKSNKIINYSLKNDVYRYVDKLNVLSSNIPGVINNVDIGYGTLPVDFNRKNGDYDIKITYGNLGSGNKFNDFILKGLDNTTICPGTYDCTYNVKNEILCDKGETNCDLIDLSVIFRPISLSNPFPGLDGNTRNPGSNWVGYENIITYNRGVKADEVYSVRKPMYEITLDAKTIRKIRSYNAKNSYTDFNLTCSEGSGRECVSSFLTDLKKGTNELNSLKIASCARTGDKWNDTCRVGG